MIPLSRFFDRIAIISLPAREDRRIRLMANLHEHGLATPDDVTWVEAVDGRKAQVPDWWKAGTGAWGCRASQLATLTAAREDGIERLLILEDDAVFHPRTGQWLSEVMPLLPANWDMFFLGGQHMRPPAHTADPRLLKGTCITRTHAYAVPSRALPSLIDAVSNLDEYQAHPSWHIDHQYAVGHSNRRWQAYAPAWWMAAQEEGYSNIGASTYPRRWWPHGNEYWHLPFVNLTSNQDMALKHSWLVTRDECHPEPPEDRMGRSLWLRDLAREAWLQGRLPTCDLPVGEINALWSAGHRYLNDDQELARLADYPANRLFPHAFAHLPENNTNTTSTKS